MTNPEGSNEADRSAEENARREKASEKEVGARLFAILAIIPGFFLFTQFFPLILWDRDLAAGLLMFVIVIGVVVAGTIHLNTDWKTKKDVERTGSQADDRPT